MREITGQEDIQDIRTEVPVAREVSIAIKCFDGQSFTNSKASLSPPIGVGLPIISDDMPGWKTLSILSSNRKNYGLL